jgi:hypothetical protein
LAVAVKCAGPASVRVAPPDGPAADCRELARRLPAEVKGTEARRVRPPSRRTAAWGDPPVRLRCGVDRPAGLTATSEVVEVDGVEWFLSERPGGFVFTTVGRATYVEVRVPPGVPREQATAPLVDLAPAISRAVPLR